MKKFSLIIILIVFMTACKAEPMDTIFTNILEGYEISDIVYLNDKIYAGGLEGVFEINPTTLEIKKLPYEFFLVKDLLVDDQNLYIGHEAGITLYDGNNFEIILDETDDVADVRINTIMMTSDHVLWAGTYGGALKYVHESFEEITNENGLLDNTVYLILEDETGGLLFGHYASNNAGISYLKNNQWTYFTVEDGLPHNYITAGLIDKNKLYIGTGFYDLGGIAVFSVDETSITLNKTIIKKWGEHGYKVRSLYLDQETLWVGTEYNGFCILTEDHFNKWTIEDGLISNEVKAITYDEHRIWLGCKNGISIVNKEDLLERR